MSEYLIPLLKPYTHFKTLTFDEFNASRKHSGGPHFHMENLVAKKLCTTKKVCILQSGTASLHLAYLLAGIKEGDHVYVPNATYIATISAVLYLKAIPVMIDVSVDTGNIDLGILEETLDKDARNGKLGTAVVCVHNYGYPCDMDKLLSLCNKFNIQLIEDAAEALGSKYKNTYCSTFGNYGVLSFNANKLCTAFGGGALLVNSDKEKREVQLLSTHYKNHSEYKHDFLGYNYRMNDWVAFLGRKQLDYLDWELQQKKNIYNFYCRVLKESDLFVPWQLEKDNCQPNRWLSCFMLREKIDINHLMAYMKKNGVELRRFWYPTNKQSFLRKYPCINGIASEFLYNRIFCLPSSIALQGEDLNKISELLLRYNYRCE